MKTAIIFVFLIALVLLQGDARRLMLEELKRARTQTEVQPSLVPAKSGVNGNGINAGQVYSNTEEGNREDKDDTDETSYDSGSASSSASATHRVYPDLPSRPVH